jgi:hypothetical protein
MKESKLENETLQKEARALYDEYMGLVKFKKEDCTEDEWDAMQERISKIRYENVWIDKEFCENGLYGVKNILGEVVIPAKFDDCVELFDMFIRPRSIAMKLGDKAVLVKTDGSGDVIEGTAYDAISICYWGPFFRMKKNGKTGLMTCDGKVVAECELDEVYDFFNDYSVVRTGDKYGFVYCDGRYVSPRFDDVEAIELDDWVKVKMGDETGYVDENDNFTADEGKAYWYVWSIE